MILLLDTGFLKAGILSCAIKKAAASNKRILGMIWTPLI